MASTTAYRIFAHGRASPSDMDDVHDDTLATTTTTLKTIQVSQRTSIPHSPKVVVIAEDIAANAPATCEWFLHGGAVPDAQPDISGPGVLAAFLTVIIALFLLSWFSYFVGAVNPALLTAYDYGNQLKPTRRKKRRYIMGRILTVFADQQLIVGVAIVLVIVANIQSISILHYHIGLLLLMASTNVCITAHRLLHNRMGRQMMFWPRLIGMSALVISNVVFCVPLVHPGYAYFMRGIPPPRIGSRIHLDYQWIVGIPVVCIWRSLASDSSQNNQNVRPLWIDVELQNEKVLMNDAIHSVIILIFAATALAWAAFKERSRFGKASLRLLSQQPLLRVIRTRLQQKRTFSSTLRLRLLTASLLVLTAAIETLTSLLFSLMLCLVNVLWGLVTLLQLLRFRQETAAASEAEWGYGQVISIVILAQPMLGIFDDLFYYQEKHDTNPAAVAVQASAAQLLTPSAVALGTLSEELLRQPSAPTQPSSYLTPQNPDSGRVIELIRKSFDCRLIFWTIIATMLLSSMIRCVMNTQVNNYDVYSNNTILYCLVGSIALLVGVIVWSATRWPTPPIHK
ncbi:Hypothetical protein D9617_26g078420 [Elsinoe fawcettii]|nr:Hypothetical protein D9617_26g078420 [Elsinoe fawcettii]